MIGGAKNSQLKHLLEGAVPEIPPAGKWSRVEVRVRRLRRRRRLLRTGSALLALAVFVPAGLWARTEIADPGQKVIITDPRGFEMGVPADVPRTPATTATLKPGVDYTFGGLWSGNVETVPARPESLPEEFFQKPAEPAPTLKGKPVWIFANELTAQQVVDAVGAVTDPWRTIVVYQPPVELDAVIDLPHLFNLSDIATVPSIFSAEPLLVREKTFEEVPPSWSINWADTRDPSYGTDDVAHKRLVYLACASFTLGSGFIEENLLRANPEIAAQREEARRTSTTMDSRYPEQRDVDSTEAQTLAQRVADHVLAQTGRRFTVAQAFDHQMIGPGERIIMVVRTVSLAMEGAGDAKLGFTLFRSEEDQLGGSSSGSFLGLHHRFDAGPGSRGVLGMSPGRNSYQAILQLADGTTVNVTSDGLHTTQADVPAPLGPEELIDLAKWLATTAFTANTASPQTTVTAFGQAQPTGSTLATGVTSTTTTLHAEELKWGESATVGGGTVTVDAPVVDPFAESSQPGFIVVYSLVTMTNTGKTPISYSGRDISLEGRHSGSTGIIDVQGAAGGQPTLEGTLAPGQTVRGTVRFNLYQDDEPVLVWLLVPWSKQIRLNWR